MVLVKIIVNECGEKERSPKWHLTENFADSRRAVCTGECFGEGEGSCVFEEKDVESIKKINCNECLKIIKWFKSLKN